MVLRHSSANILQPQGGNSSGHLMENATDLRALYFVNFATSANSLIIPWLNLSVWGKLLILYLKTEISL